VAGILLIHGAWHGPWCWDGFARRLAEHGHDVRAARLRGHDRSRGRLWHRFRDYLEDVGRAAAEFPEPPVLVGHSMGGLLAQQHLRRHPARGVVLLASLPPGSALPVAIRLSLRHPLPMLEATLRLRLAPLVATPALARALFFTAATPQTVVDACHVKLQDESYLAFLDVLAPSRPRPTRQRAPMLVLGASRDGIIAAAHVHRTARAYGTRAEIFDGMGHDMMLEPGWQRVADRIDAWVS
jgi:pimeloyl-ACP methyl ester carboxylesterase